MKLDNQDDYDDGEIVRRVRDILGARLTAYIAGVEETQTVRAWADGTETPLSEVSQRLRQACRIAAEIAQREGKEVTQVWFMGLNPYLNDRSPAEVIRGADPDLIEREVTRALEAFLTDC